MIVLHANKKEINNNIIYEGKIGLNPFIQGGGIEMEHWTKLG